MSPPPDGLLAIATAFADDALNVAPETRWPELFSTACAPSPKSASVVPPATRIVPLFSASAPAATVSPSASASV